MVTSTTIHDHRPGPGLAARRRVRRAAEVAYRDSVRRATPDDLPARRAPLTRSERVAVLVLWGFVVAFVVGELVHVVRG